MNKLSKKVMGVINVSQKLLHPSCFFNSYEISSLLRLGMAYFNGPGSTIEFSEWLIQGNFFLGSPFNY